MCGIAGVLHFQGRVGPSDAVRRMADAMHSRGPDDEGYVLIGSDGAAHAYGGPDTPASAYAARHGYRPLAPLPDPAPEAMLALGHRRLSILDLSAGGHQPMCTPDGRHWMVYNGEIYNFREVRSDLEALGERFETTSDSEVLLRAFARFGPDCLSRLNGMFAFAIWDTQERRLFMARDRIGIKPVYFHHTARRFVFASELPALLDSGLCEARVDAQGIYDGMTLLASPRPRTAFRDIFGLEPAHWMTIDADGLVEKQRYWSVPTGRTDHRRSDASYEEEFEALLEKSIVRRLVSDVEVGTFMSGGLDSTLISSLAARNSPGIKAFTLAHPPEGGMSEVEEARATAALWPMEHIVRETRQDHGVAADPAMARAYVEPFPSASPNFVISRLAADHDVTVVLNGSGADEILAGYTRFRTSRAWPWLRRLRAPLALAPARGRLAWAQDLSRLKTPAELFVHRFGLYSTEQKRQLLQPSFLAQVEELDTARTLERLYLDPFDEFEDIVQASCQIELSHYVGNHFVNRMDPIMMSFSLEGRFPFLDHELVEFAMRLPSRLKTKGYEQKRIVRRVAKRYVAPSCFEHKTKKGFTVPLAQWMAGPLRPLVDEKLSALAEHAEIYRPEAIKAIRENSPEWSLTQRQIWYLVSMQLWRENFFG